MKYKLIILGTIIISIFLILSTILYDSIKQSISLKNASILIYDLDADMLMLRRNEKDFILRKNIKYKAKFEKNVKVLLEDTDILATTLKQNSIDNSQVKDFSKYIKTYRDKFLLFINTQQNIGLNPHDGLYGSLRTSVHKAQDSAKSTKNFTLLSSVYELRKHEKDFMLRRDAKYVKKYTKVIDKLLTSTTGDINTALVNYKKDFLQLVNAEVLIGLTQKDGIQGEMRNIVHKAEYIVTNLISNLQVKLNKKSTSLEYISFLIIFILILFIIISLLIILNTIKQSKLKLEHDIKEATTVIHNQDMQLIQQSRMAVMGDMMNAIIHQWKQPLSIISVSNSATELYLSYDNIDKNLIFQNVTNITNQIENMNNTMNDFRDFFISKPKANYNINNSIHDVLKLTKSVFIIKNITINLNLEDDLYTIGYANEFNQVLINILNNARDVILEKNVSIKDIMIKSYKENDKVFVTITDLAGGIPDDIIDKIFDPYFTTKNYENGTGIGLNMSKTIIEKVNGKLKVKNVITKRDNIEYKGAEFKIILNNI